FSSRFFDMDRMIPPMTDWSQPQTVTDVELAFPAHVVGTLLPEWEDIPESYRLLYAIDPLVNLADRLFALYTAGRPFDTGSGLVLTADLDPELVARPVEAVLRSFEPRHEHKIAGVAFLSGQWFHDLP